MTAAPAPSASPSPSASADAGPPPAEPLPACPATAGEITGAVVETLGKQGPFRPTVVLFEHKGVRLVAKDYRACTALYRWTVGRWNLAREEAALRRLDGLDGIPRLVGRVDRWILVMTWLRGRDLGKVRRYRQSTEFYDKLAALVDAMHARGVVHLDLRQRRNILFRPDGPRPAVLDFGSALCLRPGTMLHRTLARIDRSGVLKYKRRAQPDSLSAEEARALRKIEKRRKLWPFS